MATLSTFFDMVYVYATETSGHGPFTLGSAVTGFQTAAAAGITNGTPVSYKATDGVNWETAHGVVDVSGSTYTLTRGVDTIKSSNSNSLVNFGSGVTVVITELSQDLNTLVSAGAAQSLTSGQQTQALENIGGASLASPVFTGTPEAPTPAISDNSTKLATTAFVQSQLPVLVQVFGNFSAVSGTTTLMCGCKASYTPTTSGRVLAFATVQIINGTGDGVSRNGSEGVVTMAYGTGTAPNNGAAATGTTMSGSITTVYNLEILIDATIVGYSSGLTIGDSYWFDFQLFNTSSGGSVQLDNVTFIFIEL